MKLTFGGGNERESIANGASLIANEPHNRKTSSHCKYSTYEILIANEFHLFAIAHNRLFRAFLAICLLAFLGLRPRPASAQSQSSPASAEQPLTTKSTDPFIIELYSTTVHFENDGTSERHLNVRVHVNTDVGAQQFKTLSFGYNASSGALALAYLRVRKPEGTVVEAKRDAVKDTPSAIAKDAPAFSDIRDVQIATPALAPGDTLDYEVVAKTLKPAAPGQFWYSHSFLTGTRVSDEELRIEVPTAHAIHIHWSPQFVPVVTMEGSEKIYSWKRISADTNSVSATAKEDGTQLKNPSPDVALTSFTDWPAVGKWFATNVQTSSAASPEITDKTQSLIASAKTDLDRIESLYDFVSKQIHLTQVNEDQTGYQIRDASKVLADGYGDTLEKSALLIAMLNVAGLHADLALMSSDGTFDADLPTPSVLEGALVSVATGSDTIWLDPAEPAMPFRLLAPNLRGKQALVASASVPPHFAGTPADPPFLSTQRVEISGRVTSLGTFTARIQYTLRGDNEYALRMAFYTAPKDQWKQVAQTMATLDGLRGEIVSVDPGDPTATHDPFVLNFTLSATDFLDWSQRQFLLALPLPAFGLPDAPSSPSKPVTLGSPLDVTTKLTLTLPVTDSARVPAGTATVRDYAEYHSTYNSQDNVVTAERSLKFLKREVPVARADDYAAFARAVVNDEGQGIAITNLIPDIPDDASVGDLMAAGGAALKDGKYSNALRLFKRVSDMDPKQPGLWNDLGLTQLQVGQFADAEASFRKQLAANPADESANNLLGVALFSEKQYDDAAAAFQKQISIKPLDASAHSSLGAVYIAQEKFQAAVAEMEKAAALSPDDAGVQIRLGEAYLGLNNLQSALKAFDKGAALSPTAAVENEIAFSLADYNVALDRAEQLAESALDKTEAQLGDLNLRGLTVQQVQAMASLAPIWDTVGWVYFREGRLEQAESYLAPAWRLEEQGSVGDHLGQIYEKRADKALAIRTYTLALAAGSAPSETRDRLQRLLGGSENSIDARVKRAMPDLVRMRTILLGKPTSNGKASFLFCLGAALDGTVVHDVEFLGGTEALASLSERIGTAKFPELFPANSKVRVVLRGVATCSAKTQSCDFVFERPSQLLTQR